MSKLKSWWLGFYHSFGDSETILWARVQILVGAIWIGVSSTDLSPLLSSKYLTYWLIANGVITELLRRVRAPELNVTKAGEAERG
jgi:hypothetical protein